MYRSIRHVLKPVKNLKVMASSTSGKNVLKVDIGSGKLVQEDFNERGYIRPSRHALLHELARICGLKIALADDFDRVIKNETFFLRHQNGIVNENITRDMISQPIHGLFTVTQMGTTSIVCSTRLMLDKQQKCISTCIAHAICVNIHTRRPSPLPKRVAEMFAYAALEKKQRTAPLLETPQDQQIHSKTVVVGDEDVDANKHMNEAAYMKFCTEVARSAVSDKMPTHVTHDILETGLKQYTSQYLGETLKGDEVTYTMWQDLEKESLLHFEAKKQDGVVFRCQYDFNL